MALRTALDGTSPGQVAGFRRRLVVPAATLWSAVVFMPLGLNYLGLALLLLALAAEGRLPERVARFRCNALRWPLAVFVGWTLFVLVVAPHYPETIFNLWHGMRIAVTIALTMLLKTDEARAAFRGFLCGALIAVSAMVLSHTVGMPDWQIWHHVITMKGNKSIGNALLFTVLGAAVVAWGLNRPAASAATRWRLVVWVIASLAATVSVVTLALPSRTSLIGLSVAVAGLCIHRWRAQRGAMLGALSIVVFAITVLGSQLPSVRASFDKGIAEIESARHGAVSEGSWVVRFHMYRETSAMMMERPWIGWGIGAWTTEWKRRSPPLLTEYNMPHNDFLWMGSQAGVPGFLLLLGLVIAGVVVAWNRRTLSGSIAFSTTIILCVASFLNSAMRDAAIGLSLPWITFLALAASRESSGQASSCVQIP